jgi:hypothetical protein
MQAQGGVDEPDRGQGLGQDAELLTRPGAGLLGEQPEVPGKAGEPGKQIPGLPGTPGQGQCLGQPETAHGEGALATFDAVTSAGPVAPQQYGHRVPGGASSAQIAAMVAAIAGAVAGQKPTRGSMSRLASGAGSP